MKIIPRKENPVSIIIGIIILLVVLIIVFAAFSSIQNPSTSDDPKLSGTIRLKVYNDGNSEQVVSLYLNDNFAEQITLNPGNLYTNTYSVAPGQWKVRAVPTFGDYDEKTVYVDDGELVDVNLEI